MRRNASRLAGAVLLVATLIAPAAVSAATVTPSEQPGNTPGSCPSGQELLKLAATAEQVSGTSQGGVQVTVTFSADGRDLDFTVKRGHARHAFVKGGAGYNHYNFTPAGVSAYTGLVAPGTATIDHVTFCLLRGQAQPTAAPTSATAATPSPTGAVAGATATPDNGLPPSDTLDIAGTASSGALAVLLMCLVSLVATGFILSPSLVRLRD
jgi:hypothetical protein